MLKYLILFSTVFMLLSCGKNTDEATAEAILTANIALSKGNCQTAIDALEANGRVNNNAPYLKTLASAYACKAGYSTLTFFTSDIAKTVVPAPLGGTTLYSTSSATVTTTLQNDQKFKDLQKAIDILLYAGGIDSTNTEPTSAERARYFSSSEAADINSQLLYMVLVQLGRYMYHYGDSSVTGVKASGVRSNTCFTSYVNADGDVKTAVAAGTDSCSNILNDTAAHVELASAVTAATRKTRLCQGVVLLNGVFAILPDVITSVIPVAQQAAALAALNVLNLAKVALIAADATTATVASTLNQTVCEDNTQVSVSNIESYFGLMFEGIFQ
ncbi:MAG: hypothetical protein HOP07_07800 [Bacteriovoracaceae bacterium]|nr:hypothetical protein [Bacteriovoracaceae bacterium]